MRVLGIDPGTVVTGWGLVEERGAKLTHIASGVIRVRGVLPTRLARIYEEVRRLLEQFSPACVSLEKSFVGTNVQTAFRLGEARGVILAAAAQNQIAIHEYSPAEVKVAVAGAGRASKDQVQTMVARLLGIERIEFADEADAIATAICHLHRARFATQVDLRDVRGRRSPSSRSAWTRLAAARTSRSR